MKDIAAGDFISTCAGVGQVDGVKTLTLVLVSVVWSVMINMLALL